jgi:CrcB protein
VLIAATDWLAALPDLARLPLWAAGGAAAGGLARHWLTNAIARAVPGRFPLGTLVVNVTGSALIGAAAARAAAGWPPLATAEGWALAAGGVLGGYTTVSSFALQALELARGRAWRLAALYALASPVLCVAAAALGWLAGAGSGS